jgi:hypothetical protein
MRTRRQNKLRRNPFVRLLRMIYRSLKVIFRSQKSRPRFIDEYQDLEPLVITPVIEEKIIIQDQFLTVGELLERVKWQFPAEQVLSKGNPQPEYDVSLN